MFMQKLRYAPVGIQSFSSVIEGNYVYVDKSQFIAEIEQPGMAYFLTRPRRFGKSLFISMLQAYFEGRRELFKGLAIERIKAERGEEWQARPVLKMDLNVGEYITAEDLKSVLNAHIEGWCDQFGIEKKFDSPSLDFAYIIKFLYNKFGQKVVFLVDEYDKPLIATLEDLELNDYYRKVLKAFYSVIKSSNDYIHLSFLTGITKFSKVSIFSDLNNLYDLSFDRAYSSICGITQEELEANFLPNIGEMARDYNVPCEKMIAMLKKKYDGYHFNEDLVDIYNPYSLCYAFRSKKLGDYWFESGTPTFMVKMLENHDFNIPDLEGGVALRTDDLDIYRMNYEVLTPFLFQSGYLTIKKYDANLNRYILSFPNDEVKYAFVARLLKIYTRMLKNLRSDFSIEHFLSCMESGDIDGVLTLMKALIASIPYDSLSEEELSLREHNYQTAIYLIFTLLNQYVRSEVHSAKGRSDIEVETASAIYIFEFKMEGVAEDAIEQIKTALYSQPHMASGKDIFLIGAVIDKKERTLGEWKIEKN